MTEFADAVVLTGATASGKSAAALDLAERLGGEIVAMDSMTLYRGFDVGTAKPTADDRRRVPHHVIDVLEPHESGNVAWWRGRAAAVVADIRSRGRRPILVGGTPFYLKAVLHGLFDAPPADPALRAELAGLPPPELFARLRSCDPAAAARLHPNDVRRVVRAVEVFTLTGRPISEFQTTWSQAAAAVPCVVLDRPRAELYGRIDARVDAMLAAGWLEECRGLLARPLSKEASQAVGYAELFDHLRGNGPPWGELVAGVKIRTRQFAKRQLTWFRGLPACFPVPADGPNLPDRIRTTWATAGMKD